MKEKESIIIATHSGQFHADDIFAVATLTLLLEKDHKVEVLRTRDPQDIARADYVVDVGEVYDIEKKRFDHHQEGRAGGRVNGIFYSSFGLVWKEYGVKVCDGDVKVAHDMDVHLVQVIDARDNGINISKPLIEGVYAYEIRDFFAAYHITWTEDQSEVYSNFMYCVDIAKSLLVREIKHIKDKIKAENEIDEVYRSNIDKRLIILNKYYSRNTSSLSKYNDVLLVISPKMSDGTWAVETIRDNPRSYESRIQFPESWAGKSGKTLEEVTGVAGSIFCHNGRFVIVAQTKEAAIALAHKTFEQLP